MSTENNLQSIYQNSIKILTDLISFKTISGENNSPLIDYCDNILNSLGAKSFKTFDNEKKRVNLFSTLKAKHQNNKKPIILSGHTDVVPVSKGWSSDPFVADIKDDKLYGRGSCDMKGFIACALAYAPIFAKSELDRDIHFSFTFDEETACKGAPIQAVSSSNVNEKLISRSKFDFEKIGAKANVHAINPFISHEPLPYSLSSLIVALNGSVDQPLETGTTSV